MYTPAVENGLNEDEALLVGSVRRFTEHQISPASADADRKGQLPEQLIKQALQLGYFSDVVNGDWGGDREGSYSHRVRALRGAEAAKGCPAMAAVLESTVEAALIVETWGSAVQRKNILPRLAAGSTVAIFRDTGCRMDVEFGAKKKVRVRGGTTSVPVLGMADYLLVVKDQSDAPSVMLLDTSKIDRTTQAPSGWRAATWGKALVNVNLDEEDFVLRSEVATQASKQILEWVRCSLAARAIGTASAAIKHAEKYAQERIQFDQPIAKFESIAALIDDNKTSITAGWALTLQAAERIDSGANDASDLASRARLFTSEVVSKATIDAVQILGGYGFVNDYPVEKLMRDAPTFGTVLGPERFERIRKLVAGEN